MLGALLFADVGLEPCLVTGFVRDLGLAEFDLGIWVLFDLGSCELPVLSNGPPKAGSVCLVYLGTGALLTFRHTGCPSACKGYPDVMQEIACFEGNHAV